MDLSTRYLGMKLSNPIVASPSPLTRTIEGIRALEAAGAGAIVMHSLFAEQINWESQPASAAAAERRQAPGYVPDWGSEVVGPDEYLDLVSMAKRTVDVPLIGSLNGVAPGNWTRYARLIEGAGADALEVNLYYIATDTAFSSTSLEEVYLDTVRDIREKVKFPIAVKIGPYFSALPWMCRRLVEAGANGIVLFNRFYEPDFDIESGSVNAQGLAFSRSEDLRAALRWVSHLYGQVDADLAITGGVHSHVDALKALMAGANVAMMASELLENGVNRIGEVLADLSKWLETHQHDSVSSVRGLLSSRAQRVAPAATERLGYIRTLQSVRPDPAQPGHFF